MFWKKKKTTPPAGGYRCPDCGQIHTNWPALAFDAPSHYHMLNKTDRRNIARLDSDFCEIRHEDQTDRFIRVTLNQRVLDNCEDLNYGLWVSLSEKSYRDYWEHYNDDDHITQYFGWLCSGLPEYDSTMSIPCTVFTQPDGQRPEIVPHEDHDHPFVRDYHHGISKAEAERRVAAMLERF